jgi:GxxExxY protein
MEQVTRLPDSIRDPETYAIIGAAMEVHTVLGPGLLESVYGDSLRIELSNRQIPHACEVEFPAYYKGTKLESRFRPDFVCNESIILEIKAIPAFGRTEEQQLINYLKVSRLQRGLMINFGGEHLQFKRFVLTKHR